MEYVQFDSGGMRPGDDASGPVRSVDDEIYLHNPTPVSDICDGRGVPDWDRLGSLTADSDVFVGELVDEELQLCRSFAGLPSEADPYWTPHQWRFAPDYQALATRTVERVLRSQEAIVYSEDRVATLLPFHEGVAFAFEHAIAQLTWRCDLGDRGERMGAVVVLDDGTVLHDDIDEVGGQHLMVFRTLEREVVHLADVLDPDNRARANVDTGGGMEIVDLAAALTTTTVRLGPVWSVTSPARSTRVLATTDGVWVVEDGLGQARPLDDAGVDSLARRLLSVDVIRD